MGDVIYLPDPLQLKKYGKAAAAVVADVHIGPRGDHLGKYSRLASEVVLESFLKLFAWLAEKEIRLLIVAGDLFDRTTISPSVVRQIYTRYQWWFSEKQGNMVVLAGNHDRSVHEMGMEYLPDFGVRKISQPGTIALRQASWSEPPVALCIPYDRSENATDLLAELYPKESEECHLILGHFGIYGPGAPPWLRDDPWYVSAEFLTDLCGDRRVHVVCGHHHTHEVWQTEAGGQIMNLGAFNPRSIAETGPAFGNVAVLHNTVDHDRMKIDLHKDAVPGIRFFERLGPTIEYHADALTPNWYFVKQLGDAEDRSNFTEPTTLEELQNGALTLLSQRTNLQQAPVLDSATGDPRAAIREFVLSNRETFSDPARVLRDALTGRVVQRKPVQAPPRRRRRR